MSNIEFKNGTKIECKLSSITSDIRNLELVCIISQEDCCEINNSFNTDDFLVKAVNIKNYGFSHGSVNAFENARFEGDLIIVQTSSSLYCYVTIVSNSYKIVKEKSRYFIINEKINKIKQYIGGT